MQGDCIVHSEDSFEVFVIERGPKAFGFHTAFTQLLADEIACDVAYHPHILRRMARPNAAGIFMKDDVEDPMDAVFDPPMAPHERMHC